MPITFTDSDAQVSVPTCPFIFTGQRFDAETGLYYYKRRYYSPVLGRFLSRDSQTVDLNLYRYVRNRPTLFVDPSGFGPVWPDGTPIGGTIPVPQLAVSFTTVKEPKPGDCGVVVEPWQTVWSLIPNSLFGGFIIQKVTVSADIEDCDGNPVPTVPFKQPYWEAFPVMPGQNTSATSADLFRPYAGGGECTKGKVTETGVRSSMKGSPCQTVSR